MSLFDVSILALNVDSLIQVVNTSQVSSDKISAFNHLSEHFLRTDTLKSFKYANEAFELSVNEQFNSGIIKSSESLGRYYTEQGQYDKAKKVLFKVLTDYEQNDYPHEFAAIYISLANIYDILSEFDLALDYYFKAEEIFEQLDMERGKGLAQMGIANVYSTSTFHKEAIEYYRKSYNNLINVDPKYASWSINNMAISMMEIDQDDSALYYFETSLQMKLELGDLYGASFTYTDIGTLYEKMALNQKALKSYEKALEMKLSLEGINPETLGSTYNKIGKQNIILGHYSNAISNLQKGIEYSKKSGSLKYLSEAYKNIAQAYSLNGDHINAFKNLELYTITKDSLSEFLHNENLAELTFLYETEQKDNAIELLNNSIELNEQTLKLQELEVEEGKRRNQLFVILLCGALVVIILILGLGWVLYKSNVNRKKTNELLAKTNEEISYQKNVIEEKHKEITDSINYAERIQRSFLASSEMLKENLTDHFVFFKPKDVVSGDFYWAGKLNNGHFAICCADSTGHGVPGAIMSILNISSLEKAIEQETHPSMILNRTRKIIIERLKKDGSSEGGKDGMDCSFVSFSPQKSDVMFSGANNSMFIVRKGELIEFNGDRMPVGKHKNDSIPFSESVGFTQKGDMIYTLTDGFPDQFGGEKNKKFMMKNVKEMFLEMAELPLSEQHAKISSTFESWKGDNEQLDDVCVIGVRI